MLSRLLQSTWLQNDVKRTMTEEPRSLKSRLLTLILMAWVIFVNLAYHWYLAKAYGPQVLERLQALPW